MSLINDTILDKLLRNLKTLFSGKQDTLTPGSNISINNDVISATDTTYTAGANIDITNNVISATDTTYSAGTNINITNGVISAIDTTYSAGTNIDITSGVISTTGLATTTNPVFTGHMSLNRSSNSPGSNSAALGSNTSATGTASIALGNNTYATGSGALSEGGYTNAIGEDSHAEGYQTYARGTYSHAEGNGTEATLSAEAAHAEGRMTIAQNRYAHAEGDGTNASGEASHAEGQHSTSSGTASHAEGWSTASGMYSHSEGEGTASALDAHAEGSGTASNNTAHAEGYSTTASGYASHAEGYSTIAASSYQHVEGSYNISDSEGTYVHIVGNGTYEGRSNAYTLDWSGNGVYAGKLTVGAGPTNNMDVATKQYVDTNAGDTLPTVTSSDSGKALIVDSNGNWDASNVPISSTVSQTGVDNTNTYNNDYRILFSTTANDTTTTEGTQKNKELTFNPYSHTLKLEGEHFGDSTGGYCTSIETNEVYTDYFQTYNSQPLKKGHAGLRSSSGGGSLILTYGDATTNPTTTNNLTATPNDITLSSTWDGTHTSLKDAIDTANMYDIIECTVSTLTSNVTTTYPTNFKYNGTDISFANTASELYNLIINSNKIPLLKVNVSDTTNLSIGGYYTTENSLYFPMIRCYLDTNVMCTLLFGQTGITSDNKLYKLIFDIHDNLDSLGQVTDSSKTVNYTYYTLTPVT